MAGMTGLEPATSGVTGQRSNQLSYTPFVQKQKTYKLKSLYLSLFELAQPLKTVKQHSYIITDTSDKSETDFAT